MSHQSHQSSGSHRHVSTVSAASPMTRVAMSTCRHHARKYCSPRFAGLGSAGVRETRPSRGRPLGILFWAAGPSSNVCDWFKPPRLLHIPKFPVRCLDDERRTQTVRHARLMKGLASFVLPLVHCGCSALRGGRCPPSGRQQHSRS